MTTTRDHLNQIVKLAEMAMAEPDNALNQGMFGNIHRHALAALEPTSVPHLDFPPRGTQPEGPPIGGLKPSGPEAVAATKGDPMNDALRDAAVFAEETLAKNECNLAQKEALDRLRAALEAEAKTDQYQYRRGFNAGYAEGLSYF